MMSDLSITNMVLDDFSTDYCNVMTTTGKFPMQKPLFSNAMNGQTCQSDIFILQ